MSNSVDLDLLQKQLQDKIVALDKERLQQIATFNREQEEVRTIEAAERAERAQKYKEAEAKAMARQAAMERAEVQRIKEAAEARTNIELAQNEAQELVRKQKEKLEWLQNEIAKVDFANEQHRKSLSPQVHRLVVRPVVHTPQEEDASVNAHILTGEAAKGTDGLEHGPDISAHLKSILRRANSEVN